MEANEYQSVDAIEGEFPWRPSSQDVDQLLQRQNLCFERCPRPKQIDDGPANKFAKIPHAATGLPVSRSTARRIRFATGTVSFIASPLRSTAKTLAPSSAKRTAVARPLPQPAPVTSAT
jgi:hypothetical protein